jgi:hypothetical protein
MSMRYYAVNMESVWVFKTSTIQPQSLVSKIAQKKSTAGDSPLMECQEMLRTELCLWRSTTGDRKVRPLKELSDEGRYSERENERGPTPSVLEFRQPIESLSRQRNKWWALQTTNLPFARNGLVSTSPVVKLDLRCEEGKGR